MEESEGERKRQKEKGIVVRDVHTVSGITPTVVFPSVPLSYARSERDYLDARASKYWLLFESVIRCLRTHGFSPHVSTYPTYPRLPSLPSLFQPPPTSIPHADIYTAPACSLYFWLRVKFDVSADPGRLLRGDAIYCTDLSIARKSCSIKDPHSLTRYL